MGRVKGGRWTGNSIHNHPDFAWLPIGDRRVFNKLENSRVDPQAVFGALSYAPRR